MTDKKLEEITKEEFEDGLENKLDDELKQYNSVVSYYNQYLKDKVRFRIEYFIEKGQIFYSTPIKNKIGFKGRDEYENRQES